MDPYTISLFTIVIGFLIHLEMRVDALYRYIAHINGSERNAGK
ncbi:MAG: hypothetical protein QXH07_06250 [Thermoplasmata archaeon]